MTNKPMRAVVFDAVGTLLHPDPAAAAVYLEVGRRFGSQLDLASVGLAFRNAVLRQHTLDCNRGWLTSEAREVERWRAIIGDVLHDTTNAEACFAALYDHFGQPSHWRCDPAVPHVFAALAKRGLKVALASNFDARLRRVVAGFPALNRVHPLLISSEVGWRKPAAAFFAAVCASVDAAPHEILFVGDDPVNDYEGALRAGCAAVLFDPSCRGESGRATISRLSAVPPYVEVLKRD